MQHTICILGASGKMGKCLIELGNQDPHIHLIIPPSKEDFLSSLKQSDIAIDFSSPLITLSHIQTALSLNKPLVIGTTGLDSITMQAMQDAALQIPILHSPNFSLGITLILNTIQTWTPFLCNKTDIHITETHHTHKKDSPSGTALAMAKTCEKNGIAFKNQITIDSFRIGDTIGEHQISFTSAHEHLKLVHKAYSRHAFAQGALIAALFLIKKPPGLYSMKDMILTKTV